MIERVRQSDLQRKTKENGQYSLIATGLWDNGTWLGSRDTFLVDEGEAVILVVEVTFTGPIADGVVPATDPPEVKDFSFCKCAVT